MLVREAAFASEATDFFKPFSGMGDLWVGPATGANVNSVDPLTILIPTGACDSFQRKVKIDTESDKSEKLNDSDSDSMKKPHAHAQRWNGEFGTANTLRRLLGSSARMYR